MVGNIFATIWSFAIFMFVVFIFVMWLWLLVSVISDLFRRDDVGGFDKVIWILVLLFLPYLGVFVYILTQGKAMGERNVAQAMAARDQLRQVVGFSMADEIEKLGKLKNAGTLSADEYAAAKAKLLA